MPADTQVIDHGQEDDKLRLVISGFLTVQIPNPRVPDWVWARQQYQELIQWQHSDFFPRAKKQMDATIKEMRGRLAAKLRDKMKVS